MTGTNQAQLRSGFLEGGKWGMATCSDCPGRSPVTSPAVGGALPQAAQGA